MPEAKNTNEEILQEKKLREDYEVEPVWEPERSSAANQPESKAEKTADKSTAKNRSKAPEEIKDKIEDYDNETLAKALSMLLNQDVK